MKRSADIIGHSSSCRRTQNCQSNRGDPVLLFPCCQTTSSPLCRLMTYCRLDHTCKNIIISCGKQDPCDGGFGLLSPPSPAIPPLEHQRQTWRIAGSPPAEGFPEAQAWRPQPQPTSRRSAWKKTTAKDRHNSHKLL